MDDIPCFMLMPSEEHVIEDILFMVRNEAISLACNGPSLVDDNFEGRAISSMAKTLLEIYKVRRNVVK